VLTLTPGRYDEEGRLIDPEPEFILPP
jgi:hypothetical protein